MGTTPAGGLRAVVILGVALAGVGCGGSAAPETSATAAAPAASASSTSSAGPAGVSALDKFRADIKAASPSQWTLLVPPALAPHQRGDWDDYRVGSPVVMTDSGQSPYRMWFVGCRMAGAQQDCGIGHATSADGVEWVRGESPVFVPPDQAATCWLSSVAIAKVGDRYLMWYSIDGDPFENRPRATLDLATSANGLAWENVGRVLTAANDKTRSIKHAVYYDGRVIHLWYFEFADDRVESLLHLTSSEGKAWTAAGGDALEGRAARVGRPWVTTDGHGGFRALLADRRQKAVLRWLSSADGTTWRDGEIERDLRIASDGTSIVEATGVKGPGGLWLWTTTALPARRSAESIGVAFKKGSGS